jgi:uncharacterized protein (DUF433 family)/DNA-binding transcriptional MerR regulator
MNSEAHSAFDIAAYGCLQAAHYVGVPMDTLRRWIGEDGLIRTPEPNALSFNNLAEAHILKAMRKVHGLSLQRIRKALAELAQRHTSAHPLLEKEFETDGVSLCVREEDAVINLSKKSQQEFKEFVALYLHRIQRDDAGRVARLYPFVVADREGEPRHISISPNVSFGKPVLAGTGISTSVIVGRFNARDSVEDLAREYGVPSAVLEDAIRWEMNKGRAA